MNKEAANTDIVKEKEIYVNFKHPPFQLIYELKQCVPLPGIMETPS